VAVDVACRHTATHAPEPRGEGEGGTRHVHHGKRVGSSRPISSPRTVIQWLAGLQGSCQGAGVGSWVVHEDDTIKVRHDRDSDTLTPQDRQ
jgi:hypothetical protein